MLVRSCNKAFHFVARHTRIQPLQEAKMAKHRFKVGQSLKHSPGRMGYGQSDQTCKVTRLLPADERGVPQYRIQCTSEPRERVANEHALSHKI